VGGVLSLLIFSSWLPHRRPRSQSQNRQAEVKGVEEMKDAKGV
jgi:hypothetical protein